MKRAIYLKKNIEKSSKISNLWVKNEKCPEICNIIVYETHETLSIRHTLKKNQIIFSTK